MTGKIGLVQTRGIGDIIMAIPIADHFIELGNEVYWPIDSRFYEFFRRAKPAINFLPVNSDESNSRDFFLNEPLQLLRDKGLDRTILLYSALGGINVCDARLAKSLKFDEYKYAIAGVPFVKKWSLTLERDLAREEALFEKLKIEKEYVLVNDKGYDIDIEIRLPKAVTEDFQVVRMSNITDSPFDWITTLERASELFLVDSAIANLVEQLNLQNKKRLYLRSDVPFTPVYRNGWQFSFFTPEDIS